jgi:hypothetical protein
MWGSNIDATFQKKEEESPISKEKNNYIGTPSQETVPTVTSVPLLPPFSPKLNLEENELEG